MNYSKLVFFYENSLRYGGHGYWLPVAALTFIDAILMLIAVGVFYLVSEPNIKLAAASVAILIMFATIIAPLICLRAYRKAQENVGRKQ